jgi:Zn-dependent M16 (insulinase) family peptidase
LQPQDDSGKICGSILGLAAVDSAYMLQTTPSINNFSDPDIPVVRVLLEYMSALEGPLWRQIRGQGLAYHYSLSLDVEPGFLSFRLFQSTNLARAYEVARQICVRGWVLLHAPC